MRYVNRQIYANETLKWFDQFATLGKWNVERQQRLRDLGTDPKPEDVDKIMGALWTAVQCSECGKHGHQGVELDTCDTEDGKPVVLCEACIEEVLDLFDHGDFGHE